MSISILGIIVLVGLPMLVLLMLFRRKQHAFALMFSLVGILLLLGFLFVGYTRQATHVPLEIIGQYETVMSRADGGSHDPSLDVLWDKLTKSQINLSEDIPEGENRKKVESSSLPQWVTTPPKAIGNVYRVSVASDPFFTEEECRRQLEAEQLPHAVCRRIEQLVAGDAGYPVQVASPLPLGIGPDYILREICSDDFMETVDSSVGEMEQVHVLLEFNSSIDNQLRQAWLNYEQTRRLESFGKYAGFAFIGLAAAYGLLRIDTWTRGYYSQQLLWGSAVAIIAVVFLLVR
ncbi:hypothetical protein [Bythopirellula polymerisocia]|nr:hypothetical protein [Bythopirellula polymerisocia]